MAPRIITVLILFLSLPLTSAAAEETATSSALKQNSSLTNICTGYNSLNEHWGLKFRTKEGRWLYCPPHHVFFGVINPSGSFLGEQVRVNGTCCPLPRMDILSNIHVVAKAMCPENTVATGTFLLPCARNQKDCSRPLRCTRINETLYSLAPPKTGIFWGVGAAGAFPWVEPKRIRRNEIPLAIRFGVARRNRTQFNVNGCVGDPIGSVLVGKRDSTCNGMIWKQILVKGTQKQEAKPFPMFPDCIDIYPFFSKSAKCIVK